MEDFLPMSRFAWVPCDDLLDYTERNILNLKDDSPYGFILEVDLEYCESLHVDHNCLPVAPESIRITTDMFSAYYKLMMKDNGIPLKDTLPKLVPNLMDKTKYVVHYRNLKYYVSQGLILRGVHRILSFDQGPWLRPYIQFNTSKRKEAVNSFEKDLFKLMNNAVFGD